MIPAVLVAAAVAAAAAPLAAREADDWAGKLTFYGWFAGIEGDLFARNKGVGAGVSLNPGGVLDKVETGFFGHAELWRGQFGALLDGAYIELSSEKKRRRAVFRPDIGQYRPRTGHSCRIVTRRRAERGRPRHVWRCPPCRR